MLSSLGLLAILACTSLIACDGDTVVDSGDPHDPVVPLVDVSFWTQALDTEDPFADRPDAVDCPTASWAVEVVEGLPPSLEIDTGLCDYATFWQPTLVDLYAGETVQQILAHGALTAAEPADAHVAIWLDGTVLHDAIVAIPAEGEQTQYEHVLEQDVPAGTLVWLHLHNHGDNTWAFGELWTERSEEMR
jgi:hypothetical protein